MTATLALLRHGETAWNRVKRLQGRMDVGLSDAGVATLSARMLPRQCSALQVCTSPMARCTQTAAHLRLTSPVIEPRLIERSWGQWEGRTLSDLRSELGPEMAENEARGWDFMAPGGESPRLVWQRVRPWLAEVAELGRSTLAVTHRGVIQVILAQATGWNMVGKPPSKLDWSALQFFTLDERGMPMVQRLNVPLPARQD